jgi:hypothetical protein
MSSSDDHHFGYIKKIPKKPLRGIPILGTRCPLNICRKFLGVIYLLLGED